MGHTGPTTGKRKEDAKRFWFQVVFCEYTPKEDLLTRLKRLMPTDAEESVRRARKKAEEDDDIVIGASMMSLKDPVSCSSAALQLVFAE